ncbi:MAG: HAD domain-containing protein [Lachnospiraceae bacterium]|nr:HAD domain-containing protein [Lachnospiraceae bacterium]
MNPVIFLDIDGVLNSTFWNNAHQTEISGGTLIDNEKVRLLTQLAKKTKAKIILHSGWKFWFSPDLHPLRRESENLVKLLRQNGLAIDGMTPDHSTEEIRTSRKFSLVKASEILAWLAAHEEAGQWIVIDDLDLHHQEIEKHQIRTDPNIGLTKGNILQAENMLSG